MTTNRQAIGDLLGPYWEEALKGRLATILAMHSTLADAVEASAGRMAGLVGERSAVDSPHLGIHSMDIPSTAVRRAMATGADSGALHGDGLFRDNWADDLGWVVDLPFPLAHAPLIATGMDMATVLVEGVDYTRPGERRLLMAAHPSTLGFLHSLMEVDGLPVGTWRMVFPLSSRNGGGYTGRYGFHRVPKEARRQVFDLVAEEGSVSRVLAAVQAVLGVMSPAVFELADGEGSFTKVARFWNDGGMALAWTTGGELIGAPLAMSPTFTHGAILRPATPLTSLVEIADRLTGTAATGLWFRPDGTDGLVLLNSDEPLGATSDSLPGGEVGYTPAYNLQVRGSAKDKDFFYRNLLDRLAEHGKSPQDLFDTQGNPVGQLFDRLGRKQPPALRLTGQAAAIVGAAGDLLQACVDNTPAGMGLVIDTAVGHADDMGLSMDEALVVFHTPATLVDTVPCGITETTPAIGAL